MESQKPGKAQFGSFYFKRKGYNLHCRVPGKWGLQQNHLPWTDQTTKPFSPLHKVDYSFQGSLQPAKLHKINSFRLLKDRHKHEHKTVTDTCINLKTGWATIH